MHAIVWSILLALAAVMEVGGDAVIRKGLVDRRHGLVALGFLVVGGYGVVVNLVRWDFSRLLGVYVAFFAVTAVLFGRVLFREAVPASTWVGLALIVVGGVVIQLGEGN